LFGTKRNSGGYEQHVFDFRSGDIFLSLNDDSVVGPHGTNELIFLEKYGAPCRALKVTGVNKYREVLVSPFLNCSVDTFRNGRPLKDSVIFVNGTTQESFTYDLKNLSSSPKSTAPAKIAASPSPRSSSRSGEYRVVNTVPFNNKPTWSLACGDGNAATVMQWGSQFAGTTTLRGTNYFSSMHEAAQWACGG
jgi:hypothetical protein